MTTPSNKRYARYEMAWSGARTAKGGVCVGSSLCFVSDDMDEYQAVVVGDKVHYADGSEALVLSGAGTAAVYGNSSMAIVGSHVSGGDHIVSTPVLGMELFIDEDDRPEGFLIPGFARDHSAKV